MDRRINFLAILFLQLSFSPSYAGGWKAIGPFYFPETYVSSFTFDATAKQIYAAVDTGLVYRDSLNGWHVIRPNYTIHWPNYYDETIHYDRVLKQPLVDSVWFIYCGDDMFHFHV